MTQTSFDRANLRCNGRGANAAQPQAPPPSTAALTAISGGSISRSSHSRPVSRTPAAGPCRSRERPALSGSAGGTPVAGPCRSQERRPPTDSAAIGPAEHARPAREQRLSTTPQADASHLSGPKTLSRLQLPPRGQVQVFLASSITSRAYDPNEFRSSKPMVQRTRCKCKRVSWRPDGPRSRFDRLQHESETAYGLAK
jgi:hypothetical protein